jgi:hypothetical protein
LDGASWVKHARVAPAERMVLSSYQYRRDYTVFQPSEERSVNSRISVRRATGRRVSPLEQSQLRHDQRRQVRDVFRRGLQQRSGAAR